jgi:hypothetical protein
MRPNMILTVFVLGWPLSSAVAQVCVTENIGGTLGSNGNVDGIIYDAVEFDDGSGPALYVAGKFADAGGLTVNNIARWDGTSYSALGSGLTSTSGSATLAAVYDLYVYDDGSGEKLYAAGDFEQSAGKPVSYIVAWDGVSWSPVGGEIPRVFLNEASQVIAWDDGSGETLYLGGVFNSTPQGGTAQVLRLENGQWVEFGGGTAAFGFNGIDAVRDFVVFDDGNGEDLYWGGIGTTLANGQRATLIRWDGASLERVDDAFTGQNGPNRVTAVFVHEGWLYVGGQFEDNDPAGIDAAGLVRWDGTVWEGWDARTGAGNAFPFGADAFAVYDDGTGIGPLLYASGNWNIIDGIETGQLARLNGGVWESAIVDRDSEFLTPFDFPGAPESSLYYQSGNGQMARLSCPFQVFGQPESVLVELGTPEVVFPISVVGAGLTFQWFIDGEPVFDGPGISGTGTSALTLSAQTPDFEGVLTCEIESATGLVLSIDPVIFAVREPECPGDYNGDGNVDFFDILEFINVFGLPCP